MKGERVWLFWKKEEKKRKRKTKINNKINNKNKNSNKNNINSKSKSNNNNKIITKTKTRLIIINISKRPNIYGLNDRVLNLDNRIQKNLEKKSFTKSKWSYRKKYSNLNDRFSNILCGGCQLITYIFYFPFWSCELFFFVFWDCSIRINILPFFLYCLKNPYYNCIGENIIIC